MPHNSNDPVLREIGLPNEVRQEQTSRELTRLEEAIRNWFKVRENRDLDKMGRYAGLHKTRLTTLQKVLQQGLESLKEELSRIDVHPNRPRGEVYASCRDFDVALVWMERVWEYYREKFDQRDEKTTLGPLLEAADEVVWSCYREVFAANQNLPTQVVQGPAPLSYIAPDYSPATWEADKLAPSELRRASDIEGLESFLQTLPIPVLRLPPWCLQAPWWLAFVAHEVGHNIQRELGLKSTFEMVIEKAVLGQGRPQQPDAERWKRWSQEIFADLFSTVMLGPWALRALLEVELAPAVEMTRPSSTGYPTPVVRLKLMARATDRLEMDSTAALGSLALDELGRLNPVVEADLALVEPILDAALATLPETKVRLKNLGGLEENLPSFQNDVDYWREHLPNTPTQPERSLRAPRRIICGALAAWQAVTAQEKPQRQVALPALAKNTIETLRKSGPEGTRARTTEPREDRKLGADLAGWLLEVARRPGPQDRES